MILIPPDGSQGTSDQNWHNLILNLGQGSWNPIPASGTPTFTGAGVTLQAYWTKAFLNAIYFNIQIFTTSGGLTTAWPVNTYLTLPVQLGYVSATGTGKLPTSGVGVYNVGAGTIAGWLEIANVGKTGQLINKGATINSTSFLAIQGFYFTGK